MRRREGPPPRVDLTLPRGAYYYMPYHADAFVRPPSATIRPPPDARPETDDDDARVRTLQPSTSARGLHSGAGAPSMTRRSVSPINARPRSAMSRGSGGASGHWSPPHSGRAGSPNVLHSGRGASSGVHLPHEAVPRLAVHRGSRGYVRVSDADLGVVVDDTPGVTELEAWGSAGRFDDGMGAAYSHRSARSTGRAQRSQSTTTAQPHGLGTPRRLNPLDGAWCSVCGCGWYLCGVACASLLTLLLRVGMMTQMTQGHHHDRDNHRVVLASPRPEQRVSHALRPFRPASMPNNLLPRHTPAQLVSHCVTQPRRGQHKAPVVVVARRRGAVRRMAPAAVVVVVHGLLQLVLQRRYINDNGTCTQCCVLERSVREGA